MPERLYRSRLFGGLVVSLLVCIVALAAGGLIMSVNLSRTLDAQKTSSVRGECRALVVNRDDDQFRHRIGALATQSDRLKRLAIAASIQNEEPTQSKIDRLCPAPLVPTKEHH